MALVSIVENFKIEKLERSYAQTGFNHAFMLKDGGELTALASAFKSDGYFLETITAVDKGDRVTLLYIFNRFGTVHRTAVYLEAAYLSELDSITGVYGAAEWFESEVYDMFGNTFKGHPCLKRLLTPEGLQGFPLLKTWKQNEE